MIRIVGDVCFADGHFDIGFGIGSMLKQNYDPFENLKFNKEDICIGNLECVISNISDKKGYQSIPFRVPFKDVKELKHFNIYSVANNHIMQHGNEAFNEMICNLERLGCNHVGSLQKKKIIFNFKEKKIGMISFSNRGEVFSNNPLYWSLPEYDEIETELNGIENCDFKIAYIHWGNEFMDYPYVEQKKFARWLIDKGIDIVLGVHPHVLQGYEIYKDKYIFYSLGNFLFNMPMEETRISVVINVDIDEEVFNVSYEYVLIDKQHPKVIKEAEVPKKYLFKELNKKININKDNEIYYKEMFYKLSLYRNKNKKWIIKNIFRHNLKEFIFMFKDFFIRNFS